MIYQGSKRYPVTEIVVHCTATQDSWMKGKPTASKVAAIDKWHRDRGWRAIGYHYVIDTDGTVAVGRKETDIGAHVKGRNRGTIGISLVGGFGGAADDKFEEWFTKDQRRALAKLIRDIASRTDVKRVTGHNRYAAKACPCFEVSDEFPWPPKEAKPVSLFEGIIALIAAIFGGKR